MSLPAPALPPAPIQAPSIFDPSKDLPKPADKPQKLKATQALEILAAAAAMLIPISTYCISNKLELSNFHWEPENLPGYLLVFAGLMYSPSTVAEWAEKWLFNRTKAWAFTIVLEAVMTFSPVPVLPIVCLCYLAGINALVAWTKINKTFMSFDPPQPSQKPTRSLRTTSHSQKRAQSRSTSTRQRKRNLTNKAFSDKKR